MRKENKTSQKHADSWNMERSDIMGNWKARVAKKRDEEVQIRHRRYFRSTMDRQR